MGRAVSLTRKEAGLLSRHSAATAGSRERHFTYTTGGDAEMDALSVIQQRRGLRVLPSGALIAF